MSLIVATTCAATWPSLAAASSPVSSGFSREAVWNAATDDWEPTVATAPTSSWVYEMTTRYGGPKMCGEVPRLRHCLVFRSSRDGGVTWSADRVMCPPCAGVHGQNDPQVKVADDGTVYAAWMNNYDVMFARSTDHGRTWIGVRNLRELSGLRWNDKPILAISPDGRDVYVAFNRSDAFVMASHDHGRTFGAAVKINVDGRYWFAEGGVVAADGGVYFSESAEHQRGLGDVRLAVLKSSDGGASWVTTFVARSQERPDCDVPDCPVDFYGAQANIAVDVNGTIIVAYVANTRPDAPQRMYVITSKDGVHFSAPVHVSPGGAAVGANFPAVAAGPKAGDFRLAFQDDRRGVDVWNTWYVRTTDGGATWTPAVRLSNVPGGAPYKTRRGHGFPYGDYGGIAVDRRGVTDVIWGEADGYAGPGGTWSARGV